MPIHDWSRVKSGIFHDFHHSWIAHLRDILNESILPSGFYALSEQVTSAYGPDILTLESSQLTSTEGNATSDWTGPGIATLAASPPQVAFTEQLETLDWQRTVVIRHVSDDRVVAMIEIVSPGNKASQHHFDQFVRKSAAWIMAGYHLLVIDIQPRTPRDPRGIHAAIWRELGGESTQSDDAQPLTLVAYRADAAPSAFVQPCAVGEALTAMPLFLDSEHYIHAPLEDAYQRAFRGGPKPWRDVLER